MEPDRPPAEDFLTSFLLTAACAWSGSAAGVLAIFWNAVSMPTLTALALVGAGGAAVGAVVGRFLAASAPLPPQRQDDDAQNGQRPPRKLALRRARGEAVAEPGDIT